MAVYMLLTLVSLVGLSLVFWRRRARQDTQASPRSREQSAQPQGLGLRLVVDIDRSPLLAPEIAPQGAPYYLLFDTETAEACAPASLTSTPADYTLIALSWQLISEGGVCLSEECHLLRQEGCTVAPEATAIHRLTDEDVLRGDTPADVLARFDAALSRCRVIVAHHLAFHLGVLETQYLRLGLEPPQVDQRAQLCTMLWGEQIGCRRGRQGERVYPSLVELFSYLHYGHLGAQVRYASKPLRDVRLLSACVRKIFALPLAPRLLEE